VPSEARDTTTPVVRVRSARRLLHEHQRTCKKSSGTAIHTAGTDRVPSEACDTTTSVDKQAHGSDLASR